MSQLILQAFLVIMVAVCMPAVGDGIENAAKPYPSGGVIEVADEGLREVLDPAAKVEKLATGFDWSEGPVWWHSKRMLLFSDVPQNKIYKWTEADGIGVFLEPSGFFGEETDSPEPGSNGLAIDPQDRLVLCQHGERQVARLNADGSFTALANRFDGKRLNSPNDQVWHANGDLYFTDPPWGLKGNVRSPYRELDFTGVYRLPVGGELQLVSRELLPNGIGLSPDQKWLYVTNRRTIVRFPLQADGTPGAKHELFFDFGKHDLKGGPDGMSVHANGTLYIGSLGGGIVVVSPAGRYLGMIRTGVRSANTTIDRDTNTLYFTADAYVARVKLK